MIQPTSYYSKRFKNREPRGCFPKRPRHLKHKGEGVACSYFLRPGSGLLTREQTARRLAAGVEA